MPVKILFDYGDGGKDLLLCPEWWHRALNRIHSHLPLFLRHKVFMFTGKHYEEKIKVVRGGNGKIRVYLTPGEKVLW